MAQTEAQTYAKSFSTTDQTQAQLKDLREKFGTLNDSDTMRRAVADAHKREFPDYIYKKSAKDIAARDKVNAQKKMDAMSGIEFALKFIKKIVVAPSTDGYNYIIVHGLSNMIDAVREDKVKKYYEEYPDLIELHQRKSNEVSVASQLNEYMVKLFQQQYGIHFPDGYPEGSPLNDETNSKPTTDEGGED